MSGKISDLLATIAELDFYILGLRVEKEELLKDYAKISALVSRNGIEIMGNLEEIEMLKKKNKKIKSGLDLALSTFKNHVLDCSASTVCIYERLLDKIGKIE